MASLFLCALRRSAIKRAYTHTHTIVRLLSIHTYTHTHTHVRARIRLRTYPQRPYPYPYPFPYALSTQVVVSNANQFVTVNRLLCSKSHTPDDVSPSDAPETEHTSPPQPQRASTTTESSQSQPSETIKKPQKNPRMPKEINGPKGPEPTRCVHTSLFLSFTVFRCITYHLMCDRVF